MLRPLVLMLAAGSSVLADSTLPTPPQQPEKGPGGAEYRHRGVRETSRGEGGEQYWLFEPTEPSAAKAPLIIFLHGFSVMDPHGYQGWIDHLVMRGNVVLYPRYQASLLTPPADFHRNTLASVRSALALLQEPGRTAVDLDRVAVAGHSAGGVGALRYAAAARAEGVPVPKAAVIIQPGQGPKNGVQILPVPENGELPRALRLVVAVGDEDSIVGDVSARRIWRNATDIPERAFVTVQSDRFGYPKLRAGHLSPLTPMRELADAMDWYGWWKLLDAACDSAFSGKPLAIDPGVGAWSNGRPVRTLKIEWPDGR